MTGLEFVRQHAHFDEGLGAHTVDGKRLDDRAALELQLADGHWARVVYYRKAHTKRGATLTLLLANKWEADLTLDTSMRLRWPKDAA